MLLLPIAASINSSTVHGFSFALDRSMGEAQQRQQPFASFGLQQTQSGQKTGGLLVVYSARKSRQMHEIRHEGSLAGPQFPEGRRQDVDAQEIGEHQTLRHPPSRLSRPWRCKNQDEEDENRRRRDRRAFNSHFPRTP